MAQRQIKLRIYPDGRVEAEIEGIAGRGCVDFIPLVEQLVGGETVDSHRTESYFAEETQGAVLPEIQVTRLKGDA